VVGTDISAEILKTRETPNHDLSTPESIKWTVDLVNRLDALDDEQQGRDIMTACACEFPPSRLTPIRQAYEVNGDLAEAHGMLEALFFSDLEEVMKLDDSTIREIISRAWGLAGTLEDNRILATKMPFQLEEHLRADDPVEKRFHYCHCPRVREIIRTSEAEIPLTYCYCGAGYYQRIWETITRKPVRVEVLETVLHGGDECKIGIYPDPDN
jgi:hypothetical protein